MHISLPAYWSPSEDWEDPSHMEAMQHTWERREAWEWPHGWSWGSLRRSRLVQAAVHPSTKGSTGLSVLADTPAQKFLISVSFSLFFPIELYFEIFLSLRLQVLNDSFPHFFLLIKGIYRTSDQNWIISFIILRWCNFSEEQRRYYYQVIWLSTNSHSVWKV